ncbi:hypothetical protein P170DRAFT_433493 [Aspergillus steynii IBT 23096]|uniref:Endonuclease/exonuclease/phosphatase domain-containing protein n=1 Tax=Aspergillus steynii IBT 23096 TaxID=1392250 RepID=A0A2I2GFA7_9EURO|nr:uncharacterized protein P170DRAFT_433493 [Aspergillus steynii IBT 23096]PLB51568.1 hypothetical protein P170DRAFT_433493 [Aspergillus steynii IBT 23096]
MDHLFQKALQQAAALKKQPDSVPWSLDVPWPQAYYSWSDGSKQWHASEPRISSVNSRDITSLALYSWNIDFMLPFPELRMTTALSHLQHLTNQTSDPENTATIIQLQECLASDLLTISQNPWIRETFHMTDIDTSNWGSGLYGTLTLVDKRVAITSCFRVHYAQTKMERDALFVEINLGTGSGKKLRLCNTHLESLAMEPPLRPAQMGVIARQMRGDGIIGAVVMGDFNAIQPSDLSLHADNGLKDAYLELGGQENADEGYTWGQQALPEQRQKFGCSRMDKAFYCGGLKVRSFERVGAGVVVPEEEREARDRLLGLGFERAWVTDHLGVKVVFDLKSELRL